MTTTACDSAVRVHCTADADTDTLYVLFGGARPGDAVATTTPLPDAPWITQGIGDVGRLCIVTVASASTRCAPGALPLAANVHREYDPEVDILTVHLVDPGCVRHPDDCGGSLTDATDGLICEVDAAQRLLSIEVLRASTKVNGFQCKAHCE
ncbi:hypothetical protein pdul_cds_175 [Pandoravirus dulcis]|uniref:Uncharacterized protein n=1 Tax=Pandoravirus dulcis TaxID=1349409 RepID=S4VVI3_9VIRU|nr:hypothetical protein pdul_cds_175 [Pandoravirus dulcis]AGO82101.1 hypothetical protein pdul_cds_175 [Pandoravirus dulcis]